VKYFTTIEPKMSFSINFHRCSTENELEVLAFIDEWKAGTSEFTVNTSGSTGTPKTIRLNRAQLIASAERSNHFFRLNEQSRVGLCINIKTIGGKMVLVRALVGNYRVDVFPVKSNPFESFEKLPLDLDFISLVPLQVRSIFDTNASILKHMKTILIGGAFLPTALETQLLANNSNAYLGFGMTETVSHIALRKLGTEPYVCLSGVNPSVENDCLVIQDTTLDIEQLKTTDLVELLGSNSFKWLGRADFVINSGGIKIHPEQLELSLSSILSQPFVIAGINDEHLGAKCVLVVESKLSDTEWQNVQAHIREQFGAYSVPKMQVLAQIPRNDSGKIQRKTLQSNINQ
jgi:O-succinylbenzoic acid--CoA ligase